MRLRKHHVYLCAAMLFWQNWSACIPDGKNPTKLAQTAALPIQRREHEGKWTRFHLLPDLCPLCRSCCQEKSLTSVRSPLPTQLQSVSESVGSPLLTQFEWVKGHTGSLPSSSHIQFSMQGNHFSSDWAGAMDARYYPRLAPSFFPPQMLYRGIPWNDLAWKW